MADTSGLDERMAWLMTRVCSSLKVKSDKFKKMTGTDEFWQILLQFMEVAHQRHLTIYVDLKDDLVPTLAYPSSLKRKAVVFLKKQEVGGMTVDLLNNEVEVIELAPQPLEQMAVMLEELYLPLLQNPHNRVDWPEVLVQDITQHIHRLIADTQVTAGQTKGRTLLPLPPAEATSPAISDAAAASAASGDESAAKDKAVVHVLESVVVNWIRQIKNVLRQEPSDVTDFKSGPLVELDFWAKKDANLRVIVEQLRSERVLKVIKILEMSRSSYSPAFRKLSEEVAEALAQTRDVNKYMMALRRQLERLRQSAAEDFARMNKQYEPVLHTIGLIGMHCATYSSPARLVSLLRGLCNDIIDLVTAYVDPAQITRGEPAEAGDKLETALEMVRAFRASFLKYKTWFAQQHPAASWKFDTEPSMFEERLAELLMVIRTTVDFGRLEKVEIGGTKGTILSTQVQAILQEFNAAAAVFPTITYDPLDLASDAFSRDAGKFRRVVRDLEQRIGAILVQGFDDCVSVQHVFKLFDSFDVLVYRDGIRSAVEKKYPELFRMFGADVDRVHKIFLARRDAPPVFDNLPPVSGALSWCRGLLDRISEPMKRIMTLVGAMAESDEARELATRHALVTKELLDFQAARHEEWVAGIDTQTDAKLNQFVLTRDADTALLHVNFDPVLVRLLREAKYLENLGLRIPEALNKLYQNAEKYYQYVTKLDMMAAQYNRIVTRILPVERALVLHRLSEIDAQLEKGLRQLNWKSPGIKDFVDAVCSGVQELSTVLLNVNHSVDTIQRILDGWSSAPLLERRDPKKLLNLEEERSRVSTKFAQIGSEGREIAKQLQKINEYFGVGKGHPHWKDYVQYVNQKVVDGFARVVRVSITYLLNNMDPSTKVVESEQLDETRQRLMQFTGPSVKKVEQTALLELEMKLVGEDLVFEPGIDGEPGGLEEIMNTWMRLFFEAATQMHRLDNLDEDYFAEVAESEELLTLMDRMILAMNRTLDRCREYRQEFLQYRNLWTDNREAYMAKFLRSGGTARVRAETKAPVDETEQAPVDVPPALVDFDAEVTRFHSLLEKLQAMPSPVTFTWLRVQAKPVIRAVSSEIRKWEYAFTEHLSTTIQNQVSDLRSFIVEANNGMKATVPKGNYEQLVKVMGYLLGVRSRAATTDTMWQPLRDTVQMLQRHGVTVDVDVLQALETLPAEWEATKKLAATVKESLVPHMTEQVDRILREEDEFRTKVMDFRGAFKAEAPFLFDISEDDAYRRIDESRKKVLAMRAEESALAKKQELFELPVRKFEMLADCDSELELLKQVWDLVSLVKAQINDWKETLWKDINTEAMEEAAKNFSKDLRAMPKKAKAWDAFTGLENYVKNFLVALPLVGELRSPSMRPRHWKQLMQATGVQFTISADFKLDDLLNLQLHKFVDDVNTIVDRANKELSMEKILADLDKTWAALKFPFGQHTSGCPLVIVPEELIETLDDNAVMLQNQMASKFIAHFADEFMAWKVKLSNVDSVIQVWQEVQRTWTHLESIFIGSADIRARLPNDSKLFDGIDAEFKELMAESVGVPLVVESCNRPGLVDRLEKLQEKLGVCEKALADYLETKRRAFPRFYFISSPDLLDILSKGNMPLEVMRHMPKLTDNIGKLEFARDGDGQVTKDCIGMYSREGEYVPFHEPCACTGAVEEWLNKLIDAMRKTLRHILADAVQAYVMKQSRLKWVREFPAQLALVGVQIYWAQEVVEAFEKLEDGMETALKDYNKVQNDQLVELITAIQGDLDKQDRQKIMTICTIDVHSRDIVFKLIQEKAATSTCFAWQSQLRHRWDDDQHDCFANIADAQFRYDYEYLDITLTQSLHLKMGGAPAGPAGTGKTETTKDLGRALGMMVYVFNCSEQMDYKSLGNIFKGLSMSGSWGCFDEFNRIAVEVLSVVASQVKSILDALREKKTRFEFQGEDINLVSTVGIFITMNPGYAGRTELPENIKSLFRPVSMVVPDLAMICEIMLVAEGFIQARDLAKKFTTLYALCKDLLSKQDHYDWGLRAIKAVLVVAGSLKRAELDVPEDNILMRALRDFNLPKIVTEDVAVFMGLIGDLFPGVTVSRKRDMALEEKIQKVMVDMRLQPDNVFAEGEVKFVLKVVQLHELLAVRHSVFVMGPSGSGKTAVWKCLARAWGELGRKTTYQDLNPKAVSGNELFGYINPQTREWKDGLFSIIMRDFANHPSTDPKWIVLDGDIDPEWIESLNTVMDDNKVLTLASNERIPLLPHMRLLFEIADLKYANPSTVSRAGILFINETDVGWKPYVKSWIEGRPEWQQEHLRQLFDKYVPVAIKTTTMQFKYAVPILTFNKVQTLVNLLTGLLTEQAVDKDTPLATYETYFVFCCVWAFGGALFQDAQHDDREPFNKWWRAEFKGVKIPEAGSVFDYYVHPKTKQFAPWSDLVTEYKHNPEMPIQNVVVHTAETTRVKYLMNVLAGIEKPVLLVGPAGSGKTALVREKLTELNRDETLYSIIGCNYYTDSRSLQLALEQPLEKKTQKQFGPPGSKRLIYFIDDLNMPQVDTYGTQSPITLLAQHLNYKHWYDRAKMTVKEVLNVQYLACMNPTAGSFFVSQRLQRQFAVFGVQFPTVESLETIYTRILQGHLKSVGFQSAYQTFAEKIVATALELHKRVATTFLPTAIIFHYQFNLRDLSNIFGGLMLAKPDTVKSPQDLARLFFHEAQRVYADRLVNEEHLKRYMQMAEDSAKAALPDLQVETFGSIYTHFARGLTEKVYAQIPTMDGLKRLLDEALEQYNEEVAVMDLVLFEDAMSHICRISRIIENPRGNALLVGVGGSGKQSLARLAAFISQYTVVQITISKTYSLTDLKTDLAAMYQKAGVKGMGLLFLLTDSQIVDERFLVYINDILATGNVPDLFTTEEKDQIIGAVRNEVKAAGIVDTNDNCWDFFIDKVRRNLHICLCFSPVGDAFRVRARKFPALVNCSMIDWFHGWPHQALISVATRFLAEVELGSPEVRDNVIRFMAHAHGTVKKVSDQYAAAEKRYNHVTPKSFLELIALYKSMLAKQRKSITDGVERLESGLIKLQATTEDVEKLKESLKLQQVEVDRKKKAADELLERVGKETLIVQGEQAKAAVEEEKMAVQAREVAAKQADCAKDLEKAEPAIIAAEKALNTLNKGNLTELKSFGKPSPDIVNVMVAVMNLLSPGIKDVSWNNAKKFMGAVDQFLMQLQKYDKEHIPEAALKVVKPIIADPDFNGPSIATKSAAAAGLCEWVRNVVMYYDIYCFVQPKREALAAANAQLEASQAVLREIQKELEKLNARLRELTSQFEQATEEKNKVIAQAEATAKRLDLANRLVGGLSSENTRWSASIEFMRQKEKVLPGDVLLAAAFISYIGAFDRTYRDELVQQHWLPYLREHAVPMTEGLTDPLALLTSDAEIARWNNEGLPTDAVSVQNATIVTNCARWPLLIDPQLQGLKWIRNREAKELVVIRLTQSRYLDQLERAITEGLPVLIENIGETLDAVLDPVIGRTVVRRGRNLFIKLGDKEVDYHRNFRLFLQTKMANPHYKPEIQAQTTLINFTVTEKGLEDQLLALVVNKERPDLEERKSELLRQQNEFKILLKQLEDDLLARLAAASGDILADTELIENLETTKKTAVEVEKKVADAREVAIGIDAAREVYRPVAARSSMLYFLLNSLWKIDPMYQYSLKAFIVVFYRAIDRVEKVADEPVEARVGKLIENITFTVFSTTSRGLFERHKLIFAMQLCLKVMQAANEIDPVVLDYLVSGKQLPSDRENPFSEFLSTSSWQCINALKELDTFSKLLADMEAAPKRWKEWCDAEKPEQEKLPQDWKNKNAIERLCIMRALRPDRMTYAVADFVEQRLGRKYVESVPVLLADIFEETGPTAPLFFVLSPGVDPKKELEALGRKLGYTEESKKYKVVSLGQGQEIVAERAMDAMFPAGGWVVLENVHLVKKWLPTLEKKMEAIAEQYEKLENPSDGEYKNFRLFLSAEPSPDPTNPSVQPGILQACIKITSEPPAGIKANMRRALANFTQDTLESCSKQSEFKTILFTLCFFHATVLERRKFGPQGWNIPYSFNNGDLTISVDVLFNYLENNSTVPWDDMRYIFGEIMYGGHISDNLDRRLCATYLERLVRPALLEDSSFELAPGFTVPPPGGIAEYRAYIEENMPAESPLLFGLHPNAEINFLTTQSDTLFSTIQSLQPKGAGAAGGMTKEERVLELLDDIVDKLREEFNMAELYGRVEERTPYVSVCLQECERMNGLLNEMRRSLKELRFGIKGDLTMSERMEKLMNSLYIDRVPDSWARVAYPSLKPLGLWFADLQNRVKQLDQWSTDLNMPPSVWLSGLFNPQSFLTAIMQTAARKNTWQLDKICLSTEVTKKTRETVGPAPKEGAYVHGLFLEGARWDSAAGMLKDSLLKELYPAMPVISLKAITIDKAETRDIYRCPLFMTRRRGPTYVWTFNLRTREREYKWILAGVALLLQD